MNDYKGNDNYGKPKSDYLNKLKVMTDVLLKDACEEMIWLDAYAANNIRSDFHWQCDACYDECVRRDKDYLYDGAHKAVMRSCGY